MEFVKTQLGRLLEQTKQAMLAGIPVVYIPTDQMEVVESLFYSEECIDSLVPRVCAVPSGGVRRLAANEKGVTDAKTGLFASIADNVKVGSPDPGNNLRVPTVFLTYASDWKSVASGVTSFIASYLGMKKSSNYSSPSHIYNVQRSLCVVVTPTEDVVPPSIEPYVRVVRVPPLSDVEIESIIDRELKVNGIDANMFCSQLVNQMIISLRGFSAFRIRSMISLMIAQQYIDFDNVDTDGIMEIIRLAKKQLLDNSNGLRWEKATVSGVAGLGSITRWLEERKCIFDDTELARCQHMDIPNGLLVSGIPGSGKSLMAKTASTILGLPLVSLDMGALLGGVMGESEHNMINALSMAEQMAPCVLWIDEIEKAFSGSSQNSSASDGGVGRRMFGKFLTWMQEKSAACFVFATSNDITCLPPELFRSERFDRKFFTFMPMAEECAQIFAANIKAQNKAYRRELDDMTVRMKSMQPEQLFDCQLENPVIWLSILNECCTADINECTLIDANEGHTDNEGNPLAPLFVWSTKVRPRNKLMTGADISALIKEAKFWIQSKPIVKNIPLVVYTKENMLEAVRHILRDGGFKPYGETNLRDIVRCFTKLYENQFVSASGRCILDFDCFDSEKCIYQPKPDTGNHFTNAYDCVLFYTIVGAINHYSYEFRNN